MTLYLVAFMEVLIYTALFILIYQILKKKVTCNLERVNDGLKAIAAGDPDTVINVRAYKEFAELSDDVNATVSSLKHYIHAAEERIDQELEVARQIQNAALPRVFPARPDFDLLRPCMQPRKSAETSMISICSTDTRWCSSSPTYRERAYRRQCS